MMSRILAGCCLLAALTLQEATADTPLFSSHEMLEMSIPLDFKTLCRPRETPDCDYQPTVLEYIDEHGQPITIPIEIRIRGGWRSLTKNCSAPLLFVRFDKNKTVDTPFDGQSMLPLTTHCGQGLSIEAAQNRVNPAQWEQFLLREYLAHLLYNEITDVSIRARLVHMTYPNPHKPGRKITNYAFFTEHFESVAARNGFELLSRHSFDPDKTHLGAANQLALFQYMIGNTDWSIVRERNVVLLQDSDGKQHPLPYDFDMSGLVNAHYAGPAPGLPIDKVTERYYLGFCDPRADWEQLAGPFLSNQDAVVSKPADVPGMTKHSISFSTRFLEKFYSTLHSKELSTRDIIDHCLPWPPGPDGQTTSLDKK